MDPASGSSTMRFLSFANDKDDAEKETKLKEAALRIEQAIAREKALGELVDFVPPTEESTVDLANDTRPLYERLLEQKNKKKEAVEDSQKLSNLVTKLDEEDISYLNEVARTRQEDELKKRLEVYDALEEKKRFCEKKIDEEEKRMKETLLRSKITNIKTSSGSSLKSKLLSSRIKIKPRTTRISPSESSDSFNNSANAIQHPADSDRMTGGSAKRSSESIDEADKRASNSDKPRDDESKLKRQKTNDGHKKDELDDAERDGPGRKPGAVSKANCFCASKNIMKCIGILPSLPMVFKMYDSSEDSDNSDEDLDKRIMPKIRRSK